MAPFRTRIDDQYLEHWRQVEQDYDLVRLLALLTRVRGRIRIAWVRGWANPATLHRLTRRFSHYFRRESEAHWSFFHNSFRAFLCERTRETPGLPDELALYQELADRCAGTPPGDPARNEELFYRARAGSYDVVLDLARSERWRAQFMAGRPPAEILEDTRDATTAAFSRRNVVALTRALLARIEFKRREYYVGLLPLGEAFTALGDLDAAIAWTVADRQLLVSDDQAMVAAGAFDDAGAREAARAIFTLAEPLDVFARATPVPAHDWRETVERLEAWAKVAPRFRTLQELFEAISHLSMAADDQSLLNSTGPTPDPDGPQPDSGGAVGESASRERVDPETTLDLRAQVLERVAETLDALGRVTEADEVRSSLSEFGAEAVDWARWVWTDGWRLAARAGNGERAAYRFSAYLHTLGGDVEQLIRDPSGLAWEERVALAEGLVRVHGNVEGARAVLVDVPQPPPVSADARSDGNAFAPFRRRFVLNRVFGALGDARPLMDVVPDPQEQGSWLLTYFERAVVTVARLSGMPWAGHRVSGATFVSEVAGLLRLFAGRPAKAYDWREGRHVATAARRELFELTVQAAARHGQDVLDALREALQREWDNAERADAWPKDLVRPLVVALLRAGATREWAAVRLEVLEPEPFTAGALETELPLATEQVQAWVAVGAPELARGTLATILASTLSVEYKDYQLQSWIEWAQRANASDPSGAPSRIMGLAGAVAATEGAEGHDDAAVALLRASCSAGPALATALLRWYIQRGEVTWTEAVGAYLQGTVERWPEVATQASLFHAHLLLPLEPAAEVSLMSALAGGLRSAAAEGLGEERDVARRALEQAVAVSALPHTRQALVAALVGKPSEAERLADSRRSTEGDRVLDEIEGPRLSASEHAERIRSVEDAQDLLTRARTDSYLIPWDTILTPFIARANGDTLRRLFDALPDADPFWRAHLRIADRLVILGDTATARRVAQSVLRRSRPAGWQEMYDGGSRLRSLALLVALDDGLAREHAWSMLADDLAAERVEAFAVATDWHRIVPLLVDPQPAVEIAAEVDAYVRVLAAHAGPIDIPSLPPATTPGHDATLDALSELAQLAAALLDHPVYALANGAQRLLLDWLLLGDPVAHNALVARLQSDSPSSGALLVLEAAARRSPGAVRFAVSALRDRYAAQDIRARRRIEMLLARLGEASPRLPRPAVTVPLAPAYQVVQGGPLSRRPIREGESGEPLPPAQDAADLVRAFRGEIELICRMAGVNADAFARDVAARAGGSGESPMPVDTEPQLKNQLERLHLRFVYRRPRQVRVEAAIMEAAADLEDRGRLGDEHREALAILLRNSDPGMLLARPAVRPAVITPIVELAAAGDDWAKRYMSDTWTEGVHVRASALGSRWSAHDDRIVIAEETWLRWLDWKRGTETRVGVRLPLRSRRQGHELESGFDEASRAGAALKMYCDDWSHALAEEYLTHSTAPSLIVRQDGYQFETPAKTWLALNPRLGQYLGWELSPEGMFRWVDGTGAIMVESLWWEEGFADADPPHFEDEVGDGWLVLAAPVAWRALAEVLGPCADWVRIERSAKDQVTREASDWREVA